MKKAATGTALSYNCAEKLFRLALAVRAEQCRLFCTDDRIILRIFIYLQPVHILFRNRHIRKDGFDRTFGQTRVTIDASIGVDQEFVGQFVKGFDGANRCAVGVLTFYARLGDNIGH